MAIPPIQGHLDLITPGVIEGWIRVPGPMSAHGIELEIMQGLEVVGTCCANFHRSDLATLGYGNCAFSWETTKSVDPTNIRVHIKDTPFWLLPDEATRIDRDG